MTTRSYLVACAAAIVVAAPEGRAPARYRSGPLPQVPEHAVGGGEVILQVSVTRGGVVNEITVARSSATFADVMTAAVRGWHFQPAEDSGPVDSKVLVAAVFRPPTINTPTLGSGSNDVTSLSRDVPSPTRIVTPSYPPQSIGNRAVLVEVHVAAAGAVTSADVIGATSGFDDAALKAARSWTFRPAEVTGAPAPTVAYIIFGFRQPITTSERE
jgi:TonB family protein